MPSDKDIRPVFRNASFLALAMAAALGLAVANASAVAQAPPVATATAPVSESARFNAFLEEIFEAEVARSPETQTFLGRTTNYDRWDDRSEKAAVADLAFRVKMNREIGRRFKFAELDEAAQLSHRLFAYETERAVESAKWRRHRYIFNQQNGAQSSIPAFLINQHRIADTEQAEAYIRRLAGIRPLMAELVGEARRRGKAGVAPPVWVYDFVINDARNIVSGAPFDQSGKPSPLLGDFTAKVSALTIADSEKARLIAAAEKALTEQVKPAFESLITLMQVQKATASTDDGVWKLPKGDQYYASEIRRYVTLDLSATEIHALGLREVARIHGEMNALREKVGFSGDLKAFFAFTRSDPQFYFPNTAEGRAEYLKEATRVIDEARVKLPSIFGILPKADVVVKAVEPFREKSAGKAFYQRPAPNGTRPGVFYVNLHDMANVPKYELEALAYHEGIPGHHMQIAIAQELKDVPGFRRFGGYTAYSEGWGLYAERLGKDLGFYADPWSEFGRLALELWRACRLVTDTGIHEMKWSRAQAIQYLADNTPNPMGDIEKGIERYIVFPGQALAYTPGMLKIAELRARASRELGAKFDPRAFHDAVLKDGPVPLLILEENLNAFIAAQKG